MDGFRRGVKMESDGENKPGKPAGLQLLTKKDVARLLACSVRMVENWWRWGL